MGSTTTSAETCEIASRSRLSADRARALGGERDQPAAHERQEETESDPADQQQGREGGNEPTSGVGGSGRRA